MSRSAFAMLLTLACGRASSVGSRIEVGGFSNRSGPEGTTGEGIVGTGDGLAQDTLSLTIVASAGADTTLAAGVRDRAGRVWTDASQPEDSWNRALRGLEQAVVMIPSAQASLPLGPTYRVSARLFGETAPTDVAFSVFAKRMAADASFAEARQAPAVQRLTPVVYLVGERVPDDEGLAIALGEAGRVLRGAGIEIDEPARVRLGGPEHDRFERVTIDSSLGSDSPELGALLASTDGPSEELPLYVVYDLALEDGSPILGITGGVPVPPVRRTRRSGLVIGSASIEHDPVRGGQVLAHEIGHALGLYHTTEADGAHHDQIDDTPDCPGARRDECDDHDAENLMFWAQSRGGDWLTRWQGEIVRRAPLSR